MLRSVLERERPAGRVLTLAEHPYGGQPVLLTEFGGIWFASDPERTWGYSRVGSPEELSAAYGRLVETVRGLQPFVGFCYTQFTDTYQETNGLVYADRTPKFPLDEMARATRGVLGERENRAQREWEAMVAALGQVEDGSV